MATFMHCSRYYAYNMGSSGPMWVHNMGGVHDILTPLRRLFSFFACFGPPKLRDWFSEGKKSACGSYGGSKKNLDFPEVCFLGGKKAPAATTEGREKLRIPPGTPG